jgi:hypothetical protein
VLSHSTKETCVRKTITGVLAVFGLVSVLASTAAAAPADGSAAARARDCGEVRLSDRFPAPPPGTALRQNVTIDENCRVHEGPVRLVPATGQEARHAPLPAPAVRGSEVGTVRELRSWSEMYDCCNIRMTGLYTQSAWDTSNGRITKAATTARQEWNREPWNAGWQFKTATSTDDCATDCTLATTTHAHAEFTYQGVFDVTGTWYANTHDTYVELKGDGTASCRFDVSLRHTFIGWNWQRGCS